jgi:hypothetical protein
VRGELGAEVEVVDPESLSATHTWMIGDSAVTVHVTIDSGATETHAVARFWDDQWNLLSAADVDPRRLA